MKVLLVNPNRYSESHRVPLGLLSLATVCKQSGYDVHVLDADLLNLEAKQIPNYTDGADAVGITAMTPVFPEAGRIAREIKRECGIPVAIGGVHASIFPEQILNTGLFTAVAVGEGEPLIRDIIEWCVGGNPPRVFNASSHKSQIPVPDYSLIDIKAYRPRYPHGTREPWTCVQTSRGCPYRCTFCSKAVFGKQYRSQPPEIAMQTLTNLAVFYGIKDITFYDDDWSLDSKRAMELCNLMEDLKLTWTCEARVTSVNVPVLVSMKDAGCRLICYGIESGDQSILNLLQKDITLKQIQDAIFITHMAGIETAGYFMLGCPGETKESVRRTLQFAQDLKLCHAQFSVCNPLPGSALYLEYLQAHTVPSYSDARYLGGCDLPVPFASDELPADYILKAVEEGNAIFGGRV
jgi:radical SAM superfamily enzyme YgiQ (UPF0313 family)